MQGHYLTHFAAVLQIKLNVLVVRFTVHLQWVRRAGNMQIALLSGGWGGGVGGGGAYNRMYFLFKGKFVYNGGPMGGRGSL